MSVTLRLLLNEMKLFRSSYILSMLFFFFYSLLFYVVLDDAALGDGRMRFLLDFTVLMFGQVFGLGFSKFNFMNPFRQDPYTRKMRVLRRLPVSCSALAVARFINMIVLAALNSAVFLISAYLLSPNAQQLFSWSVYLTFLLFVFFFSVAAGSFYVSLEVGMSIKMYWLISIVAVIFTICLELLLIASNVQLTFWLLSTVRDGIGPIVYVAALLLTALIVGFFLLVSIRRLERRDYY